jgi:hypothetical protein
MMSVEMQEEHKLRVSEDTKQREISAVECEVVTRSWRKFHNEELHIYEYTRVTSYSSSSIAVTAHCGF